MYVCICNAIREADLREAARALPGDVEAVYTALGHIPQCRQCFEDAEGILTEERAAQHCAKSCAKFEVMAQSA